VSEQAWTLADLLEAHPWRPAALEGTQPLDYLWHFEVDASIEALWHHLSDTNRLNRAMGLSEMKFEEKDGALHGHSNAGGFEHRWVEVPWDWVVGETMVAERHYSQGFSKLVRVVYKFEPIAAGVRFYAYFGFIPRSWWSRWLLRYGVGALEKRIAAIVEEVARSGVDELPSGWAAGAQNLPPGAARRMRTLRDQLVERGLEGETADKLCRLIEGGDELDVHRLQVRKLAQDWQVGQREVLRLFLHATRVGLLDLSWDVVCPHCRGVREELHSLGEVPETSSCEPCAIEFGTEADNAIEITFRIHPSIRHVPKQMFCSTEVSGKRHIKLQQLLEPGEERELSTKLSLPRYRARVKGRLDVGYLELREGVDQALSWRASDEPQTQVAGLEPRVTLVNDTAEPQIFILEDVNWADDALRPQHLFGFQEFHDLFSEQYIGAEVQLSVGEQTILFTDIVGSTRLYIDRGDPEAFVRVRKHFAEIYRIVDEQEGAVVKTIGDATMSAFSDCSQALEAARRIHELFDTQRDDGSILLRASINTGVCIAVNLNSNIDYFGHTVNMAAKLQLVSGAGDVVLSEDAFRSPGMPEYVAAHDAAFERVEFEFLGDTVAAWRWATHVQVDDDSRRADEAPSCGS
jgi:class 3 adenylate cyclase